MPVIDDLMARLDRIETELALHHLVTEYCVAADHRDRARWRAVWTADAVWETSPDRIFTGVDAICDAIEHQWRGFPVMQHATTNHLVTVTGELATGRSDVTVLIQLPDLRWIVGGGTYEDQYRREDATWRIAHRRVHRPFDLAPLPPNPGLVYTSEELE